MRPTTLSAAHARRAASELGGRLLSPRVPLSLAAVFTGGGAFVAAFGTGVHDGRLEATGGALLGVASLSFLAGLRRILEPEPTAGREGGASAATRPARRA